MATFSRPTFAPDGAPATTPGLAEPDAEAARFLARLFEGARPAPPTPTPRRLTAQAPALDRARYTYD
jgi:hypothetical protein